MVEIDVAAMREEFSKNDAQRDAGLREPDSIVKIKNLSYGPHGEENKFDIYYLKNTSTALPTIVNIHGGGFFYGDKELYRFYTMFLATQGFTVINFNYRLAPASGYPSPLEDTNALMHWLVKNGSDYFVDLENLFLVGDSAGGQLVEQYATINSNPNYAALFKFDVAPVKVKAVAMNCGAYFIGQNGAINQEFPFYFGETVLESTRTQFPIEKYITGDFPPAFIMTSSHDFLRDVAEPLADLLKSKGVSTKYKLYSHPDGSELGHVFHIDQKSAIAEKCNLAQLEFFRQYI